MEGQFHNLWYKWIFSYIISMSRIQILYHLQFPFLLRRLLRFQPHWFQYWHLQFRSQIPKVQSTWKGSWGHWWKERMKVLKEHCCCSQWLLPKSWISWCKGLVRIIHVRGFQLYCRFPLGLVQDSFLVYRWLFLRIRSFLLIFLFLRFR